MTKFLLPIEWPDYAQSHSEFFYIKQNASHNTTRLTYYKPLWVACSNVIPKNI